MCDCLTALGPVTAGGTTIFAKNSDRPPNEAQVLERHPPTAGAGTVQATHIEVEGAPTVGFIGSRPWWMWGFEHGVNDAGVAIGNETIYTTLDPRPFPPALTGMDLVRLGLERGTTAADAVGVMTGLLERYGQGGTGHLRTERPYWSSFLVADGSQAWVLETSGRLWEAERVPEAGAISNRTTIASFDALHRHPRQPVAALVDPRLEASRMVLAERPVTVDAVRRHLRSHAGGDGGWTICMHVDGAETTTASIIAELPAGPIRLLLGSPCTSVYVPVFPARSLGEPPSWNGFADLGLGARAALDELEAELERDARDDDEWAPEAWRRVDLALAALAPD